MARKKSAKRTGFSGPPSVHAEVYRTRIGDVYESLRQIHSTIQKGGCEAAFRQFEIAHQRLGNAAAHLAYSDKRDNKTLNDLYQTARADLREISGEIVSCLRKKN